MQKPKFSNDEWVKDNAVNWKARVCRACAPDPALFPLVIAITGVISAVPTGIPMFVGPGIITRSGDTFCNVRNSEGQKEPKVRFVGKIQTVVDYLRRLADHCKLSDEDRIAFFDEVRMFFIDKRAESNLDVKRHN